MKDNPRNPSFNISTSFLIDNKHPRGRRGTPNGESCMSQLAPSHLLHLYGCKRILKKNLIIHSKQPNLYRHH